MSTIFNYNQFLSKNLSPLFLSVFEIPTTSTNFTKNSSKNIQIMVTSSPVQPRKHPFSLRIWGPSVVSCLWGTCRAQPMLDHLEIGEAARGTPRSQQKHKKSDVLGRMFPVFCLFFLDQWRMNVNKYFGKGELLLKYFWWAILGMKS